jgi:hypothetical protein
LIRLKRGPLGILREGFSTVVWTYLLLSSAESSLLLNVIFTPQVQFN